MVLNSNKVIVLKSFSLTLLCLHLFFYLFLLGNISSEVILSFDYIDIGFSRFSFLFLFDFYSYLFCRFILLISCVVLYYSVFYIDIEVTIIRFLRLVLLFVSSMLALVFLPSLLGIILG